MTSKQASQDFERDSHASTGALKVGVAGARGYSGLELCRLLLKHPMARLTTCFATQDFKLSDSLPEKSARAVACFSADDLVKISVERKLDVVFLATPVTVSLKLAPQLIASGIQIIDLSGAFRLQEGDACQQAATYQEYYQIEHSELTLLKSAQYGLVPWIDAAGESAPKLIANPGCFATAVLMALLPLLKNSLINKFSIVIDAKSGTTGAGRKAEERLLHAEVAGLCLPYRIGRHQHQPEIQQFAKRFAGVEIDFQFVTNLISVRRGIIAGVYARISPELMALAKGAALEKIHESFVSAYGEDPLVELSRITGAGGNEEALLNLRRVVGSARTHISYALEGDKLYVFSLIDNLLKGAASQAVENFNRLLGVPSWLSLTEVEGVL